MFSLIHSCYLLYVLHSGFEKKLRGQKRQTFTQTAGSSQIYVTIAFERQWTRFLQASEAGASATRSASAPLTFFD